MEMCFEMCFLQQYRNIVMLLLTELINYLLQALQDVITTDDQ
jgi:hypothetical protein